jgi:phosphatidylserine decarboxylase
MKLFTSITFGLTLVGWTLAWQVRPLPPFRPVSRFSSASPTGVKYSRQVQQNLFTKYKPVVSPAVESDWKTDLEKRLKELEDHVNKTPSFKADLRRSLKQAQSKAKTNLDPALYNAFLQDDVPGWPTNVDDYYSFLRWYASFIPQQSSYPGWQVDPSNSTSAYQEVYDQLCHFYYLVDQPSKDGRLVENDDWFANWLVGYANVWGTFCGSTDSITPKTIYSFNERSASFNVTDSMLPWNKEDYPPPGVSFPPYTIFNEKKEPLRPNSPSGWLTWNQMFARELNPGLRPIDDLLKNTAITSPADCTYRAHYPIDANSMLPKSVVIKQTHQYASITQLLEGSQYEKAFAMGTFVHFFLGPNSYHRFHTPVAGVIKECFPIAGRTYLDVNITKNGQFDAPDNSEDGYEFTQARGVITIDTTSSPFGDVGIVAVVPIGMAQVSSVSMIATPGVDMPKGTQFGYFEFGGSDIILLFQEGVNPNLITNEKLYNLVGMKIAEAKEL